MNWKWLRNVLAQWQANPRLRYAVLLIIVIVAVHGTLKIADHRDAIVQAWGKDQDLLVRLQEVSAQPAWPQRAEKAETTLRNAITALPLATNRSQARAELHMWLIELARRAGVQGYQVSIEDALDVPDKPGLMQVVGKIEVGDSPWKLAIPLRQIARGLPWRQVQRMELDAGDPGRMSAIVRSYHRDGTIEVPNVKDAETVAQSAATKPEVKPSVGADAANSPLMATAKSSKPAENASSRANSAKAAKPAATPRRNRELPRPAAVDTVSNPTNDGVVQGVLQPSGKPAETRATKERRP